MTTPSGVPTPVELASGLKQEAFRLGFDRVGIAPAVAAPGYGHFLGWLEAGHDAGMSYLQKHAPVRSHPDRLLDGVRSVVMASVIYGTKEADLEPSPTRGKIARYARGADYHELLRRRLEALLSWLRVRSPDVQGRAVVDTAPLLERDFARLAGLGWIGKNTMLIDRRIGSYTFLGALLVDIEMEIDSPHTADHCGTCTRCLDACPTDAFIAPHSLDSRRCISYWTIEHKGEIPGEIADRLESWTFGCDICQEVCPWNRKAPDGQIPELRARPEWTAPDLVAWLRRGRSEWQTMLRDSATSRARRRGLLRNAAMALGAARAAEAIVPLIERLDDANEEPLVRMAAAWALGRLGGAKAIEALRRHREVPDLELRQAVARALARIPSEPEATTQAIPAL